MILNEHLKVKKWKKLSLIFTISILSIIKKRVTAMLPQWDIFRQRTIHFLKIGELSDSQFRYADYVSNSTVGTTDSKCSCSKIQLNTIKENVNN